MNPFTVTIEDSETQNQKAGFEFLRMVRGYGVAAACDQKCYTVKGHALKYAGHAWQRMRLLDSIFAVPNGAHLAGGDRAWAILRGQGARDGVPDICVPVACFDTSNGVDSRLVHHGLFVEMKSQGAKLRDSQQSYISIVESLDWKVVVAVGWVQMVEEILTYLEIVPSNWRVQNQIQGE